MLLLTVCEICGAAIVITFTGVTIYSFLYSCFANVTNRKSRKIDRKEKIK
jgi:hypothetical protein